MDLQESYQLAEVAARAAAQKQATEVVAIDVHEQTVLTDVFVVASADNERQVRAVVNSVDEAVSRQGCAPTLIEGASDYQWVLMECPGVIIHVFLAERRAYYDLERLWGDCPELDLPDFEAEAAANLWDLTQPGVLADPGVTQIPGTSVTQGVEEKTSSAPGIIGLPDAEDGAGASTRKGAIIGLD